METQTRKDLTDVQGGAIAEAFASTDFTTEDVGAIKLTRRRSPQPREKEAEE